MTPRELINKLIKEFLVDDLSSMNFDFKERTTEFVRKSDDFTQFIYFALSKWNTSDSIVDFWTIWTVESKYYKKWYLNKWHVEPMNNIIGSSYGQDLPGWDTTIDKGYRYELMNVDHKKAMINLQNNIKKIGIPFLESNSDWILAADNIVADKAYGFYHKASDFYRIANNDLKADETLNLAFDYFVGLNDSEKYKDQIELIEMKLKNNKA